MKISTNLSFSLRMIRNSFFDQAFKNHLLSFEVIVKQVIGNRSIRPKIGRAHV